MRYVLGDLVIDEEAFTVHRQGLPVAVEPRVLELTVYLIRHQARMVSGDELRRHVWSG